MLQRTSFESVARRYCARQDQTPAGLLDVLRKQRERLNPDGWFLGECQMMDSSHLGSLVIFPFGPTCEGFKAVPAGVFSPRGLASDMSTAEEWFPAGDLPETVAFEWTPPPPPWEVVVGNVGSVHRGPGERAARKVYAEYVRLSKEGTGRAGGEDVTLMHNGEPARAHTVADPIPTVAELARSLKAFKRTIEGETEVRLNVQRSGWSVKWGDPQYDQDHRGRWSNGYITRRTNCRELAVELIDGLDE